MIEKHYLLKVLGLTGIPKLVTFLLTLASFPLLLRSLGASEYGVILYVGAALGLFEMLLDFGVSSAAGKAMADVRAHAPGNIRTEFFAWARLQTVTICVGFFPMLLAAYLMVRGSPSFQIPVVLFVMATAVGFSVVLNFVRQNLQSLLAFKSMAVLDTFESVVRSTGLFLVAFLYPNALGLAISGLVTIVAASVLAAVLMTTSLSASQVRFANHSQELLNSPIRKNQTMTSRIQGSANFLWLRLSTRVFQEGPILIIGRLLGPEVIGIIGAFRKVNEIISTPYLIIGNALMVRINEVANHGPIALKKLWETAMRIVSTSLLLSILLYMASKPLSLLLLPDSKDAASLFAILSVMVSFSIAGAVIAPMSDYLGGLARRNLLLTSTAVVQLIVVWFLALHASQFIVVAGMVLLYCLMIVGYLLIASNIILKKFMLFLSGEIRIFSFLVAAAFLATESAAHFLEKADGTLRSLLMPLIFISLVALFIFIVKKTRSYYFSKKFFEFE